MARYHVPYPCHVYNTLAICPTRKLIVEPTSCHGNGVLHSM